MAAQEVSLGRAPFARACPTRYVERRRQYSMICTGRVQYMVSSTNCAADAAQNQSAAAAVAPTGCADGMRPAPRPAHARRVCPKLPTHLEPLLLRAPVQQLLHQVVAKGVHHQLHDVGQHLGEHLRAGREAGAAR